MFSCWLVYFGQTLRRSDHGYPSGLLLVVDYVTSHFVVWVRRRAWALGKDAPVIYVAYFRVLANWWLTPSHPPLQMLFSLSVLKHSHVILYLVVTYRHFLLVGSNLRWVFFWGGGGGGMSGCIPYRAWQNTHNV